MRTLRTIAPEHSSLVMTAARSVLRKPRFGVVAYGIGRCVTAGASRDDLTLNVYVRRKLATPRAHVPDLSVTIGRRTFRVIPNIIATGKTPRAGAGGSPNYSGVHSGAVISTGGAQPARGAIAAVLLSGGAPTHILTAAHLVPSGSIGADLLAAASPAASPVVVANVSLDFLASDGVDACLAQLTVDGVAMVTADGPPLTDLIAEDQSWSQPVRGFLATANDYSISTSTTDHALDAKMASGIRGSYWLDDVVGTVGSITNAGDSGTILCAGSSNEIAVGVCSGEFTTHSVFEPFQRVMRLSAQYSGTLFSLS